MRHSLDLAVLIVAGFFVGTYVLGMGLGLLHRGYNRVAPVVVRRQEPPKPTSYQRQKSWEDWDK